MNIENKEVWAPLYQWEDYYLISTLGRIKSVPRLNCKGKIRKLTVSKNGYYVINLTAPNKTRKRALVHRLVAETFLGPIPGGMQINHKNEIKTDNTLENLEIVTPKENSNWGTRVKRLKKKQRVSFTLKRVDTGEYLHFESDQEASLFFGYGSSRSINQLTQLARRNGINAINVKKIRYEFYYGNLNT